MVIAFHPECLRVLHLNNAMIFTPSWTHVGMGQWILLSLSLNFFWGSGSMPRSQHAEVQEIPTVLKPSSAKARHGGSFPGRLQVLCAAACRCQGLAMRPAKQSYFITTPLRVLFRGGPYKNVRCIFWGPLKCIFSAERPPGIVFLWGGSSKYLQTVSLHFQFPPQKQFAKCSLHFGYVPPLKWWWCFIYIIYICK